MEVRPVDPRDVSSEVDDPVYRVTFWTRPDGPDAMRSADEYEITGAQDVEDVLQWARAEAREADSFVVHAYVDGCAIRLAGEDPARSTQRRT